MSQSKTAVLVIDDEALVRFVSAAMFEELGFEVLEAKDGHEALDHLNRRPDTALLFTDCRMPGMSGPQLAHTACTRNPQLKVVLVSGYVDAVDPGPWALLPKPFSDVDIARVVAEELG